MEEVLDATMRVFWDHGYLGTSLRDIEDATGLTRGSLYKAFTGKEEMFLLALERYAVQWEQDIEALRASPEVLPGLRVLFHRILEDSRVGEPARGCLLVKTIGEDVFGEGAIHELVMQVTDRFLSEIEASLQRGQVRGELPSTLDPQRASRFLFYTVLVGARVAARHGLDTQGLSNLIEDALSALVS